MEGGLWIKEHPQESRNPRFSTLTSHCSKMINDQLSVVLMWLICEAVAGVVMLSATGFIILVRRVSILVSTKQKAYLSKPKCF